MRINKSIVLILSGWLFLSCSSEHETNNTTPVARHAELSAAKLVWFADGQRILIGHKWVGLLDSKILRSIQSPEKRMPAEIEWRVLQPIYNTIIWFDGGSHLQMMASDNSIIEKISIPSWIKVNTQFNERLVNVPFKLGGESIYVQQFGSSLTEQQVCARYNSQTKKWQQLKQAACVDSSFHHLGNVWDMGMRYYALYSEGEGAHAIDVIKTDREQSLLNIKEVASLSLGYIAPQSIRMEDSATAWLVLPCEITHSEAKYEGIRDCVDNTEAQISIYEWTLATNKLILKNRNLPKSSVLSPTKNEYAWIKGSEVCVSKLSGTTSDCLVVNE